MALAAGEHDRAGAHQGRAPLQAVEVGLGEPGAIDQQIAAATPGPGLQQPAAAPLTVAAGREQPQAGAHQLGRAA